ncbi:meiotic nuclear division protein 1 [Hesseltinella vesiculosa]|uniref:Meiotic nuclear division protein 1 n=1 Tax=Hesseltinella vesiculosa TaxID=101127 RepID=A0A1X2G5V3_9FUNG|nr:meiotic nuclear division protein 1 [Hesseltinella vesiculosa]
MSRKGVSAQEKRDRLLNVFHESCEVYQLKELEKIGPTKGISGPAVQETLQTLVDDDFVSVDKIGISKFYWSFPMAAVQKKKNRLEELDLGLKIEADKQVRLRCAIQEESQGQEESDERALLIERLHELQKENVTLEEKLATHSIAAKLAKKVNADKVAKEAANRWADQIWFLRTYCEAELNTSERYFNEAFGIDDDYLDLV